MNDSIYRSRGDWSEYSVFYNRVTPKTVRIVLNSFTLPDPIINGSKISELAVVVNSNNGVMGSNELYALGGANVKQFTFLKDENGAWTIRGGNNMMDYPSTSTTYSFRLRYLDPISRQFVNFKPSQKLTWALTAIII